MKHHITIDLPEPLRRRMSQIRAQRGTAAAHRYAHAALSHLRMQGSEAYMRKYVGSPGTLAVRALVYHTLVAVPVIYLLSGALGPATFMACLPILLVYIVARTVAAYLDGGRHD